MTELQIIKGKRQVAWQMLVYSVPGLGKSTFATTAPNPLFLDLENGLNQIDCHKTPLIESSSQLVSYLRFAYQSPDYQTVVFDTTSALEALLTKEILAEHKKASMADLAYGKGFQLLQNKFEELWQITDKLKDKAGKNIMWISHEVIRKFDNPAGENYDRYHPRLYEKIAYALTSRCDIVAFAQRDVIISEKEHSDDIRGVMRDKRMLYLEEQASHIAKNRYGLAPKIEIKKDNNEHFFNLLK